VLRNLERLLRGWITEAKGRREPAPVCVRLGLYGGEGRGLVRALVETGEGAPCMAALAGIVGDPGFGIRCLFDPWIRDPGWEKNQDPDPGSYFREL
jgi:hypothetical protein